MAYYVISIMCNNTWRSQESQPWQNQGTLKLTDIFVLFCLVSLLVFKDTFFYSLVYDPTQKTLLADKGEIRVGPRFQADVPEMLQEGKLHF